MADNWEFWLRVEVKDPAELHRRAMDSALAEGMGEDEAADWLGEEGAPNVSACLVQLFDPGSLAYAGVFEINDSGARREGEA